MLNSTILALSVLLYSGLSYAQDDQVFLDIGSGIHNKHGLGNVSIGIQEDLWYSLKDRFSAGTLFSNFGGVFVSGQMGVEVTNQSGVVASFFGGPCAFFGPESAVDGYLQIMFDFHLGLQDNSYNYLGVFYKNVSSSISTPQNSGYSIIGVEIKI